MSPNVASLKTKIVQSTYGWLWCDWKWKQTSFICTFTHFPTAKIEEEKQQQRRALERRQQEEQRRREEEESRRLEGLERERRIQEQLAKDNEASQAHEWFLRGQILKAREQHHQHAQVLRQLVEGHAAQIERDEVWLISSSYINLLLLMYYHEPIVMAESMQKLVGNLTQHFQVRQSILHLNLAFVGSHGPWKVVMGCYICLAPLIAVVVFFISFFFISFLYFVSAS